MGHYALIRVPAMVTIQSNIYVSKDPMHAQGTRGVSAIGPHWTRNGASSRRGFLTHAIGNAHSRILWPMSGQPST